MELQTEIDKLTSHIGTLDQELKYRADELERSITDKKRLDHMLREAQDLIKSKDREL